MSNRYRIRQDQCSARSCTKKAAAGKRYCGGRVCNRTSESLFGSSRHTNVRQARRDAKLGIDPVTGRVGLGW